MLVPVQPLAQKGAQLRRPEPRVARHHQRMDALPQALVGPADRQRRRHLGMRAAGEFDLQRRDLVAAAVDELLLAPADLYHARVALARDRKSVVEGKAVARESV